MFVHQTYCAAVTHEVDMCTCGALFRAVLDLRDPAEPGESASAGGHGDLIARRFARDGAARPRADLNAPEF